MPGKHTTETFTKRLIEKFGDVFIFDETIYTHTDNPVIVGCKYCGLKYTNKARHIMSGILCPDCGRKKIIKKRTHTTDMFIAAAIQIYGPNEFDYSLAKYINNRIKVDIIHNFCGRIVSPSPHDHLAGHGCSFCSLEKRVTKLRHNTEMFIKQATELNSSNEFDYSLVNYVDNKINVEIIHNKCERVFQQTPHAHLQGQKCPYCGKRFRYNKSKQEASWLDKLNIPNKYRNIDIIIENKKYNVDGFDPTTNTVYEFYGDFWHGHPTRYDKNDINTINHKTYGELYAKTMHREAIIKEAGYSMITIWETDWNKQQSVELKIIKQTEKKAMWRAAKKASNG